MFVDIGKNSYLCSMMKKLLLVVLVCLCGSGASAQGYRPYLTVGKESVKFQGGYSDLLDPGSAFKIGAGCYVPLINDVEFYIVPELSYSSFKFEDHDWIPRAQTFRYSQIHLPIVADYCIKFTDMVTLDLGTGPFVSYGFGKDAIDKGHMGHWNTGVALRASLRVYFLKVGFSYDIGLVDIRRYGTYDDSKERLSMLGLSFGICI